MAATENVTAVMGGINEMHLETRPAPEPAAGQVLVAIDTVGVCGSDVHFLTEGHIGHYWAKPPLVLGHESSGTVVRLGVDVTDLQVGDRVALEPCVPCLRCELCKSGRYNLCTRMLTMGVPPKHGAMSRLYVHPADFCYKLPDNVSLEEGALVEPFCVGLHACRRAQVTVGDAVLICGAGPIGLVCLIAARAMGATQILMTDIADHRLKVAKELGADYTLNVASGGTPEELAKKMVEALRGRHPDRTIECSGAEPSIQTGILATKRGGVFMVIGLSNSNVSIPLVEVALREVDIRGVIKWVNCYPTAISLLASGRVDLKPLVTHRFPLEQAAEAIETARTGAGGAVKVLIKCAK